MQDDVENHNATAPAYAFPLNETPVSTFVHAKIDGNENYEHVIALATMVKRLRENGDDPDMCRDVWHSGYFFSKKTAESFAHWLNKHAFRSITLCHLDCGGWLVSFFAYGEGHLPALLDSLSIAYTNVSVFGGRYVEVKVRVMSVDEHEPD